MTARQQLEDGVRRYFAERGLFLDLHTPFGPLPSRFPKPYRPTSSTMEQLPQWLDYWLERRDSKLRGDVPPLPGELELVSVEFCPGCKQSDPVAMQYAGRPWYENRLRKRLRKQLRRIKPEKGRKCSVHERPKLRRWGLRRRQPRLRNYPFDYGPVSWEDVDIRFEQAYPGDGS
jgi:hypothetical protein